MDLKATAKAKARLALARERLAEAEPYYMNDYPSFSQSWYGFLVAFKNIYTVLEQGAKTSPQSRQWFGSKKRLRREDPLLQYLFHARDADEHGVDPITINQNVVYFEKDTPGFSNDFSVEFKIGEDLEPESIKVTRHDGLPAIADIRKQCFLIAVTDKFSAVYNPPTIHLGCTIPDESAIGVGKLALEYMTDLVEEAETLA